MDGLQPFHIFFLSLRSLSPFCFTTTCLLERDNIERLPAQTHLRAGSIFILPPPARRYDISATKLSFEGVRRRRGAAAWWTVVPREDADRAARARAHRGHLAQDQDHFRHHRRGRRAGARQGRAGTLYRDLYDLLLTQVGAVTPAIDPFGQIRALQLQELLLDLRAVVRRRRLRAVHEL